MRLLEIQDSGDFKLTEFLDDNVPRYAILSHTWGNDVDEVTFRDLAEDTGKNKTGYGKIRFCGKQTANDGLRHFWIDTCCIDKSSSTELGEAINSMFRWYQDAAKCYVFLTDVTKRGYSENDQLFGFDWKLDFKKSRWFTRGWTLQELLAPMSVEFFSKEGYRLGDKKSLEAEVHEITGIAIEALRGKVLSSFTVNERISWAAKRATKRKEDQAYSLLGIFDVYMPLIYGERERAFIRLMDEIDKASKILKLQESFGRQASDLSQAAFTSLEERYGAVFAPMQSSRTIPTAHVFPQTESLNCQSIKIIFGIDFGAYYSRIYFAHSDASDFKNIRPWTIYPADADPSGPSVGCESAQVPSVVAFASENPGLAKNAWGYQVTPKMKFYSLFKHLLEETATPKNSNNHSLKLSDSNMPKLPLGMSAKEVVAAFLRGIYEMLQTYTENSFGALGIPIDFWFTVPPVWTDKAKFLMKQAVTDAGFGTTTTDCVFLMSKFEAVIHSSLKSNIYELNELITVGSGVLLCDCGKDTVDIITYRINSIAPLLEIEELCPGIGARCGESSLSHNLYNLMSKRFGQSFASLDPTRYGPESRFTQSFENSARNFSMKHPIRRRQWLPLRMRNLPPDISEYYDEDEDLVILVEEDMKYLFDPVVDTIIKLIDDQMNQTKRSSNALINTLIITGDFFTNEYPQERLKEWCSRSEMRLITPWTGLNNAAAAGAVIRGLEKSALSQKKSRRHYGYTISKPYDPLHQRSAYDLTIRKVWKSELTGKTMLSGFMVWGINKGDIIDENTKINIEFSASWTGMLNRKHNFELFSCGLDAAPDSIEDPRVEKLCKVEFTFDGMDVANVKQTITDSGSKWYSVDLNLIILLGDPQGIMVFKMFYGGKEKEVRVDFGY